MTDTTPTIDELRAQHAALERQLAEASIAPAEAFAALLGSAEIDDLLAAITKAAEPLDDGSRTRIAQWTKMRTDLVTLANLDVARMRQLVAPAQEG